MKKGVMYGIVAYALWGFFPLYWKLLHDVPAPQVIAHRISWSFVLLMVVIAIGRQATAFRSTLTFRTLGIYSIAALLIAVNWLAYVWAVNAGFVVETSLGYFINPLLSVLLGVIVLRERLRPAQWFPLGLAAAGVFYLTAVYGSLPWIALTLAVTFAFYGLVKKVAPLSSLFGLTLETGILFVPAVAYLAFAELNGNAAFLHAGRQTDWLLISAGLVTTIPLLLFASAAEQVPLTVIGLLQYIAPSIQFLLGVYLYKEPFDRSHLIGYSIVWAALIIFWVENYLAHRMPVTPLPEMGEG